MDALAFSGHGGPRRLALALRELSGMLEAGTISVLSLETSSSIHTEDQSVQHLAVTYLLSAAGPGICPPSSPPSLHS